MSTVKSQQINNMRQRATSVSLHVQNWGLELAMASLLVAAFLACNVLSLLYMFIIAVGMAARVRPRRRAWRYAFVPLLGLLLLFQYTILIW